MPDAASQGSQNQSGGADLVRAPCPFPSERRAIGRAGLGSSGNGVRCCVATARENPGM
ncbi:hypothetical protein GCM10009706_29380 [Curtobacterium citreum]|nr:hypothetical protein GCM10009706_29380 [Curtobacterium citreum]